MATKYILKRTCGFSGNNAYKGRLLYSDSDRYKSESCYTLLGTADLGYSGEGWVPTNQEASVLAAVGVKTSTPQKAPPYKVETAESIKQATANSSGGWFGNVIGQIGGSIEFGRKKAWLPFAIVFGIVIVLVGGFMFKTK